MSSYINRQAVRDGAIFTFVVLSSMAAGLGIVAAIVGWP